ncbi:MAG: hypothetical protein LBL47_01265 [Lactobacillus sp.]|nr:hypothetical protein [Lactobacillus sp.]
MKKIKRIGFALILIAILAIVLGFLSGRGFGGQFGLFSTGNCPNGNSDNPLYSEVSSASEEAIIAELKEAGKLRLAIEAGGDGEIGDHDKNGKVAMKNARLLEDSQTEDEDYKPQGWLSPVIYVDRNFSEGGVYGRLFLDNGCEIHLLKEGAIERAREGEVYSPIHGDDIMPGQTIFYADALGSITAVVEIFD